jgi:hypothetical protein
MHVMNDIILFTEVFILVLMMQIHFCSNRIPKQENSFKWMREMREEVGSCVYCLLQCTKSPDILRKRILIIPLSTKNG